MYDFFFGDNGILNFDSVAFLIIWLVLTVGGIVITFLRDKERTDRKRLWHSLSEGIIPGAVYIGIATLINFIR